MVVMRLLCFGRGQVGCCWRDLRSRSSGEEFSMEEQRVERVTDEEFGSKTDSSLEDKIERAPAAQCSLQKISPYR